MGPLRPPQEISYRKCRYGWIKASLAGRGWAGRFGPSVSAQPRRVSGWPGVTRERVGIGRGQDRHPTPGRYLSDRSRYSSCGQGLQRTSACSAPAGSGDEERCEE